MKSIKFCTAILAAALSAAMLNAAHAQAAQGGCQVSPNPVVEAQAWAVTAWGLTPFGTYYMKINQANDPSNNAHPNWTMTAGADGVGHAEFANTNVSPDLILKQEYGNGSVSIYPNRGYADASGRASCRFAVTSQ